MSESPKNSWPLWFEEVFVVWWKHHGTRAIALFLGIFLPLLILGQIADGILEGEILPFDKNTLLYIRHWHTPTLDSLMLFVSTIGGPNVMTGISILVLIVLALRHPRSRALFFGLAMLGEVLLNQGVKLLFARPRPTLWDHLINEPAFSFPSGHAMASSAFAAALTLILWYTPWRWPVFILGSIFVVLVGFSRLYLGVHYPSDVLGGILASLAWVTGLRQLFRRREQSFRESVR